VSYTRFLHELRSSHTSTFGGKSSTLGELITAGIPVPPGFAASTSAYRAFVEECGLAERIDAELARMSPDDVDSVGHVSRAISEAMRSAPVPDAVRDEVERRYAELGADVPVAVRSSALGEDSQDATYAGQQETYLWVRGAGDVCDALRNCWISLFSPAALTYRARLGRQEAAMGVTIQLMVDAEVSGVLFTCNPVTGDPSMDAINASWGLGQAVVGGEVTPDDFLVSKVTRDVVRRHIHPKEVEYVPDAAGRRTVRVAVAEERREVACLETPAIEALVEVARRIERYFGSHQDVEWALARGGELPERLFVLQSRPVTALPRRETTPASSAFDLVMNAFGAGARKG
jgi:pyruvate,water dikinase